MKLSVIIVNYNTYDLSKACILSVLKALDYAGFSGEVLVVDNDSPDGSGKRLEEDFSGNDNVEVILNDSNAGFSKANNLALKRASGDYLLLLNSDTVVEEDALAKSVGYLETHPQYGALGCKVLLPDGRLDAACKRSFPTPLSALFHFVKLDKLFPGSKLFGNYNLTYLDEDSVSDVECITGAFLCISREAYEDIGGLDEDYFMYAEDTDWCYRLVERGYKIVYYPAAEITHYKKASWDGVKNPKVLDAFYDSMLIFYDKHYKEIYSPLTNAAVRMGVNSFKGIDRIRNKIREIKNATNSGA